LYRKSQSDIGTTFMPLPFRIFRFHNNQYSEDNYSLPHQLLSEFKLNIVWWQTF